MRYNQIADGPGLERNGGASTNTRLIALVRLMSAGGRCRRPKTSFANDISPGVVMAESRVSGADLRPAAACGARLTTHLSFAAVVVNRFVISRSSSSLPVYLTASQTS